MVNDIFYNQIAKYNPNSEIKIKNAMKEVLQDIMLVGISKSDFFKHCSFYGGTALRLFKGLPRFSEDLDFTLIENDKEFELSKYFPFIKKELESLNLVFDILFFWYFKIIRGNIAFVVLKLAYESIETIFDAFVIH